jgi:next-to-BRCA1 protein 1
LAPDGEIEVSVDLVAPERPGRYVSHWRLVAPAGPKYGHRVWVLIQVAAKSFLFQKESFITELSFVCE